MGKKLAFEYVKSYIENVDNNEYELLSEKYIDSKAKLKVKHVKCGYEYEAIFDNFQQGRRCPICSRKCSTDKRKLSYDKVKNIIESSGDYKLLSDDYINAFTKLKIKHEKLGIQLLVIEEKDWYDNRSKCEQIIKEFLKS